MNVSEEVELVLQWYKDGKIVDASYEKRSLRFIQNAATEDVQKAYFNLDISDVRGNKSGNYSVKFFNHSTIDDLYFELSEAYVLVTVDEAQSPAFTRFPMEMTNCSSNSSSPTLYYTAVGFPKPVYTLRCSGVQYESSPSASGEFLVPFDVCCLGAQCVATAYNNYHKPIDSSPTLVKALSPSSSCQQRISDLSIDLVILQQSRTLASFKSDLNGQFIDIISDDINATLEAFCYQNVSNFTQLELRWFKDGRTIDYLSMVPHVCTGSPEWSSWMICSLRLPLFSISGNLSGNYSVEVRQTNAADIMASAWVMVSVSEVQRPTFTVCPKPMISCSSANTTLNYVAVGFPRPVFTLRCSGVQYESEPSTSGQFHIPPEVCCLGSKCWASADNGYGDPVDSNWTIANDLPASANCQQHIDCLSPGMKISLKTCTSSTYGGQFIDVAPDDLNATLEASSYQQISTLTELQLTWSKDGSLINVSDSIPRQRCAGSEEWGSWTRCGFRLPLAALKGNKTGNYSVELRQVNGSSILASAWVVITVGNQSLYNCSVGDITPKYPNDVSSKFPNTCSTRPAGSISYAIASASASGFVVLTAVLVTAICCRNRNIRMLAALKGHSVRRDTVSSSNITAEPCPEYEATAGTQGFSSDNILREPSLFSKTSSNLHHSFKFQMYGSDGILETDGGSASFTMQSSSVDDATSQVDQLDRGFTPGHHSSTRLHVVTNATASPSFSDTCSQPTLVVINARNVQLGSGNTMIINSNPGCTSDSLAETETSPTFEGGDIVNDELDAQAPTSYHLALDEDCDSAVEAEYCTSSLDSIGRHDAYEESGTHSMTNCRREPDKDCGGWLQRASSDLPAHICAAALPAASQVSN